MSEHERKIVMLGDSHTGKSALVDRFIKGGFSDKYYATAGARPYKKRVEVMGHGVTLSIWDIAGHTFSLHPAFYSDAHGAMLVCDVTRPLTAHSLPKWHESLVKKVGNIPVIAVANKCDLKAEFDMSLLKSLGFDAIETSALDGTNVNIAFAQLANKII